MLSTNRTNIFFKFIIGISILLSACERGKEVEIQLPEYKNELVVECYVEPERPLRLLLTKSVSYFDRPGLPFVNDAEVTITHHGKTDTLFYTPFYRDIDTSKIFNYVSPTIIPYDFNSPYTLQIKDREGRRIIGTTQIIPPVKIDTVTYAYEEDSVGYALIHFKDDPSQNNFYRFLMYKDTLLRNVVQDILFDDALTTTSPYLYKSGNNFIIKTPNIVEQKGKEFHLIALVHLDESYFNYLKSIKDAKHSNGNPFAQPPAIRSNIEGGIGIFTGLSYSLKLEYRRE